jgi:hypothetical protein
MVPEGKPGKLMCITCAIPPYFVEIFKAVALVAFHKRTANHPFTTGIVVELLLKKAS